MSDHRSLRRFNLIAGVAHAAQACLMVALSNSVSLPVTALFATTQPGRPTATETVSELFRYPLGLAVALFSALSAFFHFVVASGWGYPRYSADLNAGRNRFRWVEYSISSSLMIVLIAGLTGVNDVAALVALFGVNASMILFGWLMELMNPVRPAATWTPFVFGCIAGVVPWISILIYLVGSNGPPTFVYGIFVSLFVCFNSFAITQFLQYRAHGRWADYLRGERVYIWLSLIAKTLLAWQIFANVLV